MPLALFTISTLVSNNLLCFSFSSCNRCRLAGLGSFSSCTVVASRPGALALEGRGVGGEGVEGVGGEGVEDSLEATELSSLEMTEGRRRRMISPVD